MTPSPITPDDSLAAVVAELRSFDRGYSYDNNRLADRIERLDAEMRKELDESAEECSNKILLCEEVAEECEQLRAKLAACEADAERYRRIRNGPYSDRHGDVYAMVFDAEEDVPVHGDVLDAAMDAIFKRESPNG